MRELRQASRPRRSWGASQKMPTREIREAMLDESQPPNYYVQVHPGTR